MGFVELLVVAVGLSMDAFAVSVCKGLCMRRVNWRHALVIALFFGAFQALMPLIGWLLGTQFAALITPVDHWVAFVLLALIGGKMIWDAVRGDDEDPAASCPAEGAPLDLRELTLLAVATSIDALAVGVTLAFLGVSIGWAMAVIGSCPAEGAPLDLRELTLLAVATSIDALAVGVTLAFLGVSIGWAMAVIGVTTFALSFVGVAVGNRFGARFEGPAALAGGVVLILIGLKILLEHLGVLG